jgi:3-oxoacyl-[acyl-carrier protein] reductase
MRVSALDFAPALLDRRSPLVESQQAEPRVKDEGGLMNAREWAVVHGDSSAAVTAVAAALAEAGWNVLTSPGEIEAEGPCIGCLVVLIGQAPAGGVLDGGLDRVEQVLLHNVANCLRLVQAAAPRMVNAREGASIVLVLDGLYDSEEDQQELSLVGTASSGALERAVQVLACELGPRGVRVNAVRALTRWPHSPLPGVPLNRTATADDIAAVVRFLASSQASYVTGVVVPVDGGAGAIR